MKSKLGEVERGISSPSKKRWGGAAHLEPVKSEQSDIWN